MTSDQLPDDHSFRALAMAKLRRLGLLTESAHSPAFEASQLVEEARHKLRTHSPEASLISIDRAVALAPDIADAWAVRAQVLQALKQWAEAIASYERALALDSSNANTWFNKATVYINGYGLIGGYFEVESSGVSGRDVVLGAFDSAMLCLREATRLGSTQAAAVLETLAPFRGIAARAFELAAHGSAQDGNRDDRVE